MKGFIYKITCNSTNEVYFGSTIQKYLCSRIIGHKTKYKAWKEGKHHFLTSFQIIDRGNYSYSLIETVECENRRQLEQRERIYIENNECINKNVPTRTKKEWSELNKDNLKDYRKMYYESNREKINERVKQYSEVNKDKIKEYQKNYHKQMKDI